MLIHVRDKRERERERVEKTKKAEKTIQGLDALKHALTKKSCTFNYVLKKLAFCFDAYPVEITAQFFGHICFASCW